MNQKDNQQPRDIRQLMGAHKEDPLKPFQRETLMKFLSDARLDGVRIAPMNSLFSEYDGKRLTELNITTSLYSQKDVDDLIKYLQIHKYCFEK